MAYVSFLDDMMGGSAVMPEARRRGLVATTSVRKLSRLATAAVPAIERYLGDIPIALILSFVVANPIWASVGHLIGSHTSNQ
jgi:hypothetical protein